MLFYMFQEGRRATRLLLLGSLRGSVYFFLPRWEAFSLTKDIFISHRTHRLNRTFLRTFRTHRRPPAYRIHRTLLPKMAVRFCEIGWLNVSVECCVFCSSVFFCERKNNCETRWGVFSLTELTDLTEPFAHSFEPTEGLRHTEFTEPFSYYHY